jgi:hypothetical protein
LKLATGTEVLLVYDGIAKEASLGSLTTEYVVIFPLNPARVQKFGSRRVGGPESPYLRKLSKRPYGIAIFEVEWRNNPARFVGQQRVDADGLLAQEVVLDNDFSPWEESSRLLVDFLPLLGAAIFTALE